jgi:hypothetical protein
MARCCTTRHCPFAPYVAGVRLVAKSGSRVPNSRQPIAVASAMHPIAVLAVVATNVALCGLGISRSATVGTRLTTMSDGKLSKKPWTLTHVRVRAALPVCWHSQGSSLVGGYRRSNPVAQPYAAAGCSLGWWRAVNLTFGRTRPGMVLGNDAHRPRVGLIPKTNGLSGLLPGRISIVLPPVGAIA